MYDLLQLLLKNLQSEMQLTAQNNYMMNNTSLFSLE